jgi:hypothetical protein
LVVRAFHFEYAKFDCGMAPKLLPPESAVDRVGGRQEMMIE